MVSYKFNTILLDRIFELKALKQKTLDEAERIKRRESFTNEFLYDRARLFTKSEEFQKLIVINEKLLRANSGVLQ